MIKQFLRPKVLFYVICGILVGCILFYLGDIDDSPGLSFIGLAAAFIMIMRGVYHSSVLAKGCHISLVLFVFGAVALVFPVILFLDGEIEGLSAVTIICFVVGVIMISAAIYRFVKFRHRIK